MTRMRVRKQDVGVSLFPFLAVLICTMGALIVLLVMVVQLARADADERPPAADQENGAERQLAQDLRWRQQLWQQQREKLSEDVARNRDLLGHLEEHIRELESDWTRMQRESTALDRSPTAEADRVAAATNERVDLRRQIEQARDALDEARRLAAQRRPSYAIVPYDGPNGTHRRPIYLECTRSKIILQPEGVILTDRDFNGPLGPGNPLDAALRAIRRYVAQQPTTERGMAPYPLLLVRPDGVHAYAAARAAMRDWDDEFGYELVGAQTPLNYGSADPALTTLLEKVIADARSRQQILAAAMPGRRGRGEQGFVAASGGGGFVPRGGLDPEPLSGPSSGWEASGSSAGDAPAAAGSSQAGSAGAGSTTGANAAGSAAGSTGSAKALPRDAQPLNPGSAGQPPATNGGESSTAGPADRTPLVQQRGANWGLPGRGRRGTGVTRPIRLACLPDRLILLPETGDEQRPMVVLIEGSMVDEVDSLVRAVWDRIDHWGIAVAGGYWKPVLQVTVGQGADSRFQALRTLLAGSGLDVKRTNR